MNESFIKTKSELTQKNILSLYIEKFTAFLILFIPVSMVMIPKGKYLAALLLIVSCVGLLLNRVKVAFQTEERIFLYVFFLYFCVHAINILWFKAEIRELDVASRFLIVLPIFFYLRKSNIRIDWFCGGILLAAITIGISSLYDVFFLNIGRPTSQVDIGAFGMFSAIFALLSLSMLNLYKSNKYIRLFSLLGFLGGTIGVVFALTRGVWISFFLTTILFLLINPLQWNLRKKIIFTASLTLFMLTVYFLPDTGVSTRIDQATSNIYDYFWSGLSASSAGARLEMWRASLKIIENNLIFGVGENNFNKHLTVLVENREIDNFVGRFRHPHNEYLSTLVEQGIIGLITLFTLFLVPLVSYYKRLFIGSYEARLLMLSGAIIILIYMGFSLTSGVFDHQIGALFYTIFMAIIMGIYGSYMRRNL
jgi:O-antigen ligase